MKEKKILGEWGFELPKLSQVWLSVLSIIFVVKKLLLHQSADVLNTSNGAIS